MQKRIYLASPYTSPESRIRRVRYWAACAVAAKIIANGELVFSPKVHSHPLAENRELPPEFDFWQSWCLSFLRHWATHFCILDIPGWQESRGIMAEKELAEELGLPVFLWTELMEQYGE